MCGLVTVAFAPKPLGRRGSSDRDRSDRDLSDRDRSDQDLSDRDLSDHQRYRKVWAVYDRLMKLSTARGTDAAGAALIRRGGGFTLVKAPVPPDQLTQRAEYTRMASLMGEDSALLMGHARRITKGPASNPCNNHPILVDAVEGVHGRAVGIHNGTITNDDLLFAKYGYPRDGEVDSEVIFRLVAEACRFKTGKR